MDSATLARCVVAITAWMAITQKQIGAADDLPGETFAALRGLVELVEETAGEDEGCAQALHALRRKPQSRGAQAGLSESLGRLLQEERRLQAELVHHLTLAGSVQSQDGVVRIIIRHPARPDDVLFTFELEFVSPVAARLTPPPQPFFRKVPDVEDILATFEESSDLPVVMALTGPSGIGKTAYARELADRLADRTTSGIQVEVSATSPDAAVRDAAEIVHEVLVSVGVQPGAIPRTLAARTAMVREKTTGRRPLFLLEDCTDFDLVRQLLPDGRSAAIVTTDAAVQGPGARLGLDRLNVFEAANLLNLPWPRQEDGQCTVAEQRAAADRLLRLCDGLPLSLRLLRGHIADCSAGMLPGIADQLASAAKTHAAAGTAQPVFSVLDLCYPKPLTRGFRVLAVAALLAAPVYDLRLLAEACAEPVDRTASVVEDLVGRSLLEPYGRSGDRWQLHPLIARYARARIGPMTGELTPLMDRAVRAYLARLKAFAALLTGGPAPDPVIAAWARTAIADDLPVAVRATRLFGPLLSASIRSLTEQLVGRFRTSEDPSALPGHESMSVADGTTERPGDGEPTDPAESQGGEPTRRLSTSDKTHTSHRDVRQGGTEPASAPEPSELVDHMPSWPHDRNEAGDPPEAAETGEASKAQEFDDPGKQEPGEADEPGPRDSPDDRPPSPGGPGPGRPKGSGPQEGGGGSGGTSSPPPKSPVHAAITKAEGEPTASPRNPTIFGAGWERR